MKLYFAAIGHFDPLCKPRLLHHLQSLRRDEAVLPTYIAVEWDPNQFERVKDQRKKVYDLASRRWPDASDEFLDALRECVAFEGDAHLEVFPAIKTLWLDEGRDVRDDTVISRYAEDRLNVYASYFDEQDATFDQATLLEMSDEAWAQGRMGEIKPGGTDRDARWAKRVAEVSSPKDEGWAIVIVGANHATGNAGYLRARLEAIGFDCEAVQLNPNYDHA